MSEGQQIENVCYEGSWTETNEEAFRRAFKTRGRKLRFAYADPKKRYLSPAMIDSHAPKIGAAVGLIKRAKGVCFLYSHFKWSGVYPAAVALEEAGFVPFKGDTMLEDAPASGSSTAPRYVVITKEDESEDGMSVTEKVAALNDPSSRIKVVLGTDTAAQGLDFKRVREVHVLEPWWNMSKIRQVTGRGIRRCSHASLDKEYRNTTVYLHCTVTADERETQDQHGYRTAINKNTEIERVEELLSDMAVDCGLYEMRESGPIKMESSQGNDVVARRGTASKPKCAIKWPAKRDDASTVHPYVYKNMVDLMAWEVKDALTWMRAGTFKQIKKSVGAQDDLLLSLTLTTLLNPMLSWRWLKDDAMVERNGLYVIVPAEMKNRRFTLQEASMGFMFGENADIRIR